MNEPVPPQQIRMPAAAAAVAVSSSAPANGALSSPYPTALPVVEATADSTSPRKSNAISIAARPVSTASTPAPVSPPQHATSAPPASVWTAAHVASTSPVAPSHALNASPLSPHYNQHSAQSVATASSTTSATALYTAHMSASPAQSAPSLGLTTSFYGNQPAAAAGSGSSSPRGAHSNGTPFQAARVEQAQVQHRLEPAAAASPSESGAISSLDDPDLEDFYLLSVSKGN